MGMTSPPSEIDLGSIAKRNPKNRLNTAFLDSGFSPEMALLIEFHRHLFVRHETERLLPEIWD